MSPKANQKRNRKVKLFNAFSTNLNFLSASGYIKPIPFQAEIYVCPQCFRVIEREMLDDSDIVSLEHVPPRALGGSMQDTIITCTPCNNRAGHDLDALLVKFIKFQEFTDQVPNSSHPLRVAEESLPSHTLYLEWRNMDNARLSLDRRQNSEQARLAVTQYLQTQETITVETKGTPSLNVAEQVALLRIAYLYAFRIFGYGLIVHDVFSPIREQINNPQMKQLPGRWHVPVHYGQMGKQGLYILEEPANLRSLLLVFPIITSSRTIHYGIVLPAISKYGLNVYEEVERTLFVPEQVKFNIRGIYVHEDVIQNPRQKFFTPQPLE